MSHKINLERCAPLTENYPAATPGAPELPPMPADFPAELLTPEQLDAVQAWWADWQQDMLCHLRHLLTMPHERDTAREAAPLTLRHLQHRAVVLCHLLGLHPAAERNLSTLAAELGVALSTLSTLRGLLLRAMVRLRQQPHSAKHPPSIARLQAEFPLLAWERREGKRPVVTVPFRQRLCYASQFELCGAIAAYPGISCTLTLTSAHEDALRITFHNKK